jgi:hypothetical protein
MTGIQGSSASKKLEILAPGFDFSTQVHTAVHRWKMSKRGPSLKLEVPEVVVISESSAVST